MINKENSNRGGALLSVVIVMTIVGVLGALAISIAYTNYTMKVVDKKSKDNFYSAEKVLEEICVGLEKVASDEYKIAYTQVMSQYSPDKKSSDMEAEFRNLFVVNMISKLKAGSDATKYVVGDATNRNGLYQYVKNVYRPLKPDGTIDTDAPEYFTISAANGQNNIDTLEDGFAIRNVNIKYLDGNYYNEITTDIKISIPEVHFTKVSAMPEIAEFSIIAEGGILVDGGSGTGPVVGLNLVGKAYAGIGDYDPETATQAPPPSIVLESGAIFNAESTESVLVVSKGDIYLEGNTLFKTGSKTALWTNGIETKMASRNDNKVLVETNNTINLNGRVYVNDDTILNGYRDKLVLAGQYYGFSNSDISASSSSSLIINGKDIQIDMTNLNTLVLAGTSFVGTNSYAVENRADIEQNILMGDSVAIKSNQLAYLVPTECAGITSNPMTHAQYQALPDDWEAQALSTYLTSIHSTLASYGEVDIIPVFGPNQQDGGTVYLYLNFADSETASRYFMNYYNRNKLSVDKYLNSYLDGFKFNTATTRIVTQGNYLVPVDSTYYEASYVQGTGDTALNVQELTNYESSFNALCKKLITNDSALNDEERVRTVYENLVDEDVIDEFFSYLELGTMDASSNILYDEDTGIKEAIFDEDIKVYIVDNDENGSPTYEVNGQKGIVIATGDVMLSGDWQGLIICGGKLTKTGTRGNLVHDTSLVGRAMQIGWTVNKTEIDDAGLSTTVQVRHKVLNFFRSGNTYTTGSFGDKVAMTDVRNIVSYENYKSE